MVLCCMQSEYSVFDLSLSLPSVHGPGPLIEAEIPLRFPATGQLSNGCFRVDSNARKTYTALLTVVGQNTDSGVY